MNFVTGNLHAFFPITRGLFEQTSFVLPIGISFFTFQAVSYVVDVYADRMFREIVLDVLAENPGAVKLYQNLGFEQFTEIFSGFNNPEEEKPDVVISTGVLASIPMLFIGHIFKKKVIYIESFAKINSPTMTGKLIYKKKIANQFYVQWESMLEFYPDAICKGGIY